MFQLLKHWACINSLSQWITDSFLLNTSVLNNNSTLTLVSIIKLYKWPWHSSRFYLVVGINIYQFPELQNSGVYIIKPSIPDLCQMLLSTFQTFAGDAREYLFYRYTHGGWEVIDLTAAVSFTRVCIQYIVYQVPIMFTISGG